MAEGISGKPLRMISWYVWCLLLLLRRGIRQVDHYLVLMPGNDYSSCCCERYAEQIKVIAYIEASALIERTLAHLNDKTSSTRRINCLRVDHHRLGYSMESKELLLNFISVSMWTCPESYWLEVGVKNRES